MTRNLLAVLLCLSPAAYGQGIAIHDNVTTAAKNVPMGAQAPVYTVPFARITVCNVTCASPVPIYSDVGLTQPIQQPLIADSQGRFDYYVSPGSYFEQIASPSGSIIATIPVQLQGVVGQIVTNPSAGQAVVQPSGTTFSVNSFQATSASAQSMNGVINAALMPGAIAGDMGLGVQQAVNALSGKCGAIYEPAGTYTWATPATKLPCQQLLGNGSVNNVTALNAPALTSATSAGNQQLIQGGIRDVTFIGPGPSSDASGATWTTQQKSQIGVYLGGDSSGSFTPAGWLSVVEVHNNLHVHGFGKGIYFGNSPQHSFFGSSVEGNYDGVVISANGLENMNWHGSQILNNIRWGFTYDGAGSGGLELNLNNVSVDYNGQGYTGSDLGGALNLKGGYLSWHGGHIEGPKNSLGIYVSGPSYLENLEFTYSDGQFNIGQVLPQIITVSGSNGVLSIDNLHIADAWAGGSVAKLINWTANGADNHVHIEQYLYQTAFSLATLPPGVSSANVQYGDYPSFNTTGDIIGRTFLGVVTAPTFIGTGSSNIQTLTVPSVLNAASAGINHIVNAAGLQSISASGCTVAAGTVGTSCNVPLTLSVTTNDVTYTPVCSLSGTSGAMFVGNITNSGTGTITVAEVAGSTTATGGGTVHCIVVD